ncbi:hypothetical protein [Nocardioides zeae]|uniref:Uncharacterized protein n=1 Tax=Nocardioides zeae TaxID=1457234 RepID=A0A6P0HFL8_9ACTN|nr:hypothetical protein [Nocardioides zeae]NEN77124.1 hypothetical protein [Nocardioides zeae]
MTEESIGIRVQRMPIADQALVLASIVSGRSEDGTFSGRAVTQLFYEASLPVPDKIANVFTTLKRAGRATPAKAHGAWTLTPLGRQRVAELVGDDAAALLAEALPGGADLGHFRHALIPASLAPPQLVRPVAEFTRTSPPAAHVFGMTRFPDDDEEPDGPDPVAAALDVTRDALDGHGLRFLLASQRALVDDLWGNVAAHMWSSNYGIAFFEDRRGRGMNYNLVIEVGAMLMAGRRCLLLKDSSIKRMPTDLVGFIYKSVDLDDPATITQAVHEWAREDLALGRCKGCPEDA